MALQSTPQCKGGDSPEAKLIDNMIMTPNLDMDELKPHCELTMHMTNVPEKISEFTELLEVNLTDLPDTHISDLIGIILHISKQKYIPYVNYIHVINYDMDVPVYYLKIINEDFHTDPIAGYIHTNNIKNHLRDMYILYKPYVWDEILRKPLPESPNQMPRVSKSELIVPKPPKTIPFWRRLVRIFPLSIRWSKGTGKSQTSFEMSTIHSRNKVDIFIDLVTVVNCFSYVFMTLLRTYSWNSFTYTLINDPFKICTDAIFRGLSYAFCGLTISNVLPPTTNVLFNGLMGYAVYLLYMQKS